MKLINKIRSEIPAKKINEYDGFLTEEGILFIFTDEGCFCITSYGGIEHHQISLDSWVDIIQEFGEIEPIEKITLTAERG